MTGGSRSDILIGDADANRLIAYGGRDVVRGGPGPDELIGWGDGDVLDPGSGSDRVKAGRLDLPLLADGQVDRTDCGSSAPVIRADSVDRFQSCAPLPRVRRLGPVRRGQPIRLALRCPPPTAVPCRGRFAIHMLRGRRISRTVRFGPVRPGRRVVLTVPLLRPVGPTALIRAVGVTLRRGSVRSSTRWAEGL